MYIIARAKCEICGRITYHGPSYHGPGPCEVCGGKRKAFTLEDGEKEKREGATIMAEPQYWIAFNENTGNPLTSTGNIGVFVPMWDNPISATEWAQLQSKGYPYYVRQVDILYSPRPLELPEEPSIESEAEEVPKDE